MTCRLVPVKIVFRNSEHHAAVQLSKSDADDLADVYGKRLQYANSQIPGWQSADRGLSIDFSAVALILIEFEVDAAG